MARYALYFAPDAQCAWWDAGCLWLGRDPANRVSLDQPPIPGIDSGLQQTLTSAARRYGFHATLKAPFSLAEGQTLTALDNALETFCAQQKTVVVPMPEVQWMGNFLALRPGADNPAINALALQCVSHFDHFRAPPSEQEIQRRRQHPLSERQLGLLQKWGYPYTDEEFRFHLTLSDAIDDHRIADAFYRAAVQYFDIPEVMRISEIALFFEATAGADFRLLRRYPLTGKKPFE